MSAALTAATAGRVLRQVRGDHRTVALLLVVPCVLIGLLAWVYEGTGVFDRIGAPLLGVFPFVVMFLVTSVATLRERTSGRRQDGLPDLLRVVLDPAGPGEDLLVLELAGRDDLALVVEDHRAGGCGALVDGEDVVRHGNSFVPVWGGGLVHSAGSVRCTVSW